MTDQTNDYISEFIRRIVEDMDGPFSVDEVKEIKITPEFVYVKVRHATDIGYRAKFAHSWRYQE